jgi:hypothetical protein
MNETRISMSVLLCMLGLGCAQAEGNVDRGLDDVVSQSAALKREVYRSSWNGASASASVALPDGWAYLDVWENRTGNQRTASLNYSIERFDPDSLVCQEICFPWYCGEDGGMTPGDDGECPEGCSFEYCYYTNASYEYGWGTIPAGDFNANAKVAALQTDISGNPNFYAERCEISGDEWSCSNVLPSETSFAVRWQADGMFSSSNNGISRYNWGPYSYQSQGNYSSASATATGSFGSVALPGTPGSGWLSRSQGGSVTKVVLGEDGGGGTGGTGAPLPVAGR